MGPLQPVGLKRSTTIAAMKPRWLTFTICTAVAAGLLLGGMALFDFVARPPADAGVTTPSMTTLTKTLPGDLIPPRGNDPAPSPVPALFRIVEISRIQLIGVIAPGNPNLGSQGVALISIDGKPAQTFRVGDMLHSDRVLQAIQSQSVSIGPRGSTKWISLELAAPGLAADADLRAGLLDNGQVAVQPRPALQISVGHPPAPQVSTLQGSAPNVLLNNPAEMAPADASGNSASSNR